MEWMRLLCNHIGRSLFVNDLGIQHIVWLVDQPWLQKACVTGSGLCERLLSCQLFGCGRQVMGGYMIVMHDLER